MPKKKLLFMIQTKQTVLLWLAALLPASLFKIAMANKAVEATSGIFMDGAFTLGEDTVNLISYVVAAVLAIAASLVFKNRDLQVKLSMASLLAYLILFPLSAFLAVKGMEVSPGIGGIAVIAVSVILLYLSIRFIKKDIETVRSMDRLR